MEMLNDVLITLTHTRNTHTHTVFNIYFTHYRCVTSFNCSTEAPPPGGTRKRVEYI